MGTYKALKLSKIQDKRQGEIPQKIFSNQTQKQKQLGFVVVVTQRKIIQVEI